MSQTIEMIKTAADESQLRRVTAGNPSLPSQLSPSSLPTLPPQLDAAFPVVKDRMVANLNSKLNAALNESSRLNPVHWQSFFADAIRNGIQAGLLATAFLKITNYHNKIHNRSRSQTSAPSHS
jgi:hypothetical protein